MSEYRVQQSTDGRWRVVAPDGEVIACGLSNANAWRMADMRNGEADTPHDKLAERPRKAEASSQSPPDAA